MNETTEKCSIARYARFIDNNCKIQRILIFREYGSDENVLNEALTACHIVAKGREKYQKNTFGHGLIRLKQSVIEEKLRLLDFTPHRQEAFKILQNAVGQRILEEMLQDLKIQRDI